MKKILLTYVAILTTFYFSTLSYALSIETHETLNKSIAQGVTLPNGFSLDMYLKDKLLFEYGVEENFVSQGITHKVWEWLRDGGKYEDVPVWYEIYRRSVNHFHDPLRPLNDAGFTGIWGTYILSGQSAILWSQRPLGTQTIGGYYSWYDVRTYFYNALTSYNPSTRDTNFAETFRGVGQLMHLVQDMSVPEHARDDGHYSDAYEEWIRDSSTGNVILSNALAKPIFFDMTSLMNPSPFGVDAPVPIARLFDTRQYYQTNNPGVTTQYFTIVSTPTGAIGVDKIGLAEYTNANFLSPDTIFTDNLPTGSNNYFPYPKRASAVLWNDTTNNRYYFKKTGDGEPVDHLAACGLLCTYMVTHFPQSTSTLAVSLDDKCKAEYASKLLPRAIGYSAGLLNYFFRGSIDMFADSNGAGYIIKNNSGESLVGNFRLYYDDTNDNRTSISGANWDISINANGQSAPLTFPQPADPTKRNPTVYMLVFKGQMGQEQNAVVGKVIPNLPLEPPTPVSPLAGGYIYGPDHDNGLVWNAISGGNGNYEVSIDDGPSIVVAGTKYTNVSGLGEGAHTWKVSAQNSAGTPGPWSQPINFTKYDYLVAPTIVKPLEGGYTYGLGPNPYDLGLMWDAITGSNGKYEICIDCEGVGTPIQAIVAGTTYGNLSALAQKTHTWKVRAYDSRAVAGLWSTPVTFTKYNYLPAPVLSEPDNGVDGHNISLWWHTVQDAAGYYVCIDGTCYYAGGGSYGYDGYNTTPLKLADGYHYWWVFAIDSRGISGYESLLGYWIEKTPPCNATTLFGGAGTTTNYYELGKEQGTFTLSWDTYQLADKIDVIYQGNTIYSTGWVTETGSHDISYSGLSSVVTIQVTGGGSSTEWVYTVGCP